MHYQSLNTYFHQIVCDDFGECISEESMIECAHYENVLMSWIITNNVGYSNPRIRTQMKMSWRQ